MQYCLKEIRRIRLNLWFEYCGTIKHHIYIICKIIICGFMRIPLLPDTWDSALFRRVVKAELQRSLAVHRQQHGLVLSPRDLAADVGFVAQQALADAQGGILGCVEWGHTWKHCNHPSFIVILVVGVVWCYHVCASTGEYGLFYHKSCESGDVPGCFRRQTLAWRALRSFNENATCF